MEASKKEKAETSAVGQVMPVLCMRILIAFVQFNVLYADIWLIAIHFYSCMYYTLL